MKKIIILIFFIFIAVSISAQDVDLAYKFRENAHHKFKEKTTVKIDANFLGEEQSATSLTVIDIDEVIKLSGENAKITQTCTTSVSEIDGESNLDTKEPDEIETTVIYDADKRGMVLGVADKEGTPFEEYDSSNYTPLLPNKNVKIGDTWDILRSIDNTNVKCKCTLSQLYSKEGVDIAKIDMVFDDVIKDDDGELPMEITVKGKGVFYFAINYGNDLYMAYNVDFETSFDTELDDGIGSVSMKSNFDYVYWRCK